jgi:hypothetical protein
VCIHFGAEHEDRPHHGTNDEGDQGQCHNREHRPSGESVVEPVDQDGLRLSGDQGTAGAELGVVGNPAEDRYQYSQAERRAELLHGVDKP